MGLSLGLGLKFNPWQKGGVCGLDQVIDIIDYVVEDEKDTEDLKGSMDRKK